MIATTRSARCGLTSLETICTLLALGIGVGVGLVTVRGGWSNLAETTRGLVAAGEATATEEPDAASDVPAEDTSTPVAEPATVQPPLTTNSELNAELTKQLRELRREVSLLRSDRVAPEPTTANVRPAEYLRSQQASSAQKAEQGRRTLAYWNKLNDIMENEESMRRVPFGGLTKSNAANFMKRRDKAGRFAIAAFDKLDDKLVDPDAVDLAREIRDWYAAGVELNRQGSELHRSNDAQARQGTAGKSWGDATKHHNQSVAELNRRGDRLQEKLTQRYGLRFPDLR